MNACVIDGDSLIRLGNKTKLYRRARCTASRHHEYGGGVSICAINSPLFSHRTHIAVVIFEIICMTQNKELCQRLFGEVHLLSINRILITEHSEY